MPAEQELLHSSRENKRFIATRKFAHCFPRFEHLLNNKSAFEPINSNDSMIILTIRFQYPVLHQNTNVTERNTCKPK